MISFRVDIDIRAISSLVATIPSTIRDSICTSMIAQRRADLRLYVPAGQPLGGDVDSSHP